MLHLPKNYIKTLILLPLIWGFSFFAVPISSGEIDQPETICLSLEDAVKYAFKYNKDIQIREEEVRAAKSGITAATSIFLPHLDTNSGYSYNDAAISLNLAKQPKKDPGIFAGYRNDFQFGLTAQQSIVNGGANIANWKEAKLNLRIQEETLRSQKLDVEFEAKRLYYGLLFAFETERINMELVNQAKAHYENVKSRYQQGTSSKFDLLQSEVRVSTYIPGLIKAENNVDLITAELNKLMGFNVHSPIRPTERLRCKLIKVKEQKFLKEAYARNPAMSIKLLGIDVAKWAIWVARSTILPKVDAKMDYGFRSRNVGNMFNYKHNLWDVGVTVKVPIFDGFYTKAKVDEAKAKYAEADLSKINVVDQITVDIRQACLDLKEAEAIINSQKDSIKEAREALKISEVGYDNGVTTNLDVLDAQVALSQVEQNLAGGIYDYLMARAFLDRTRGRAYLKE